MKYVSPVFILMLILAALLTWLILSTHKTSLPVLVANRTAATSTAPVSFFDGCCEVSIRSSAYDHIQKALYYKSSLPGQPLLVSLHTWGGTYLQEDTLALLAIKRNWNYIHPDYGGAQWTKNSCCYDPSVQDIDDAIDFVIKNADIDTSRIIVIGKSGGGSGVLASYLRSRFGNAHFISWSPIPDHISWYNEVRKDTALRRRYLARILEGTNSGATLNLEEARKKSPQHYDLSTCSYPLNKKLLIYCGLRDGLDGWSTSLSQPLRFYNKLLSGLPVQDSSLFITSGDFDVLVKDRKPVSAKEQGLVGNRKLVYSKRKDKIELNVFDGGHEILYDRVVEDLNKICEGHER